MITANDLRSRLEGDWEHRSGVPTRVAMIDAGGMIVAVNKDWTTDDSSATFDNSERGMNYFHVCAAARTRDSRKALAGVQDVMIGKTESFTMDYRCHSVEGPRSIRMTVTPIVCGSARSVISHTDISDLKLSKEKDYKRLQQFARRLISVQDEERQRIAREIHDDLGNKIAILLLSVRQDMKQSHEKRDSKKRDEMNKVLEGIAELSTSLRELSHRLHPPPLRYLGIGGALKSLRDDFEKAYTIHIDLVVWPQPLRFPDEVELSIFRIAQEGLQNVAKHSGADSCQVLLEHTSKQIRLTVSDSGRGFDRSGILRNGGLGLISMEERALSIQGALSVNSSPGRGTQVRLTVPVQEEWNGLKVQ